MQDALNGEQRLSMEKLARERAEIQRAKDQLLDDQKTALASIYESRSQLAEERAKVEAVQKNFHEQKHRDLLQNATVGTASRCDRRILARFQTEAETRAQLKLAAEQLARLERREEELRQREDALIQEKRSLTELKQRLEKDRKSVV